MSPSTAHSSEPKSEWWFCGSCSELASPGAASEEPREPTNLLKLRLPIWPSWIDESECWWYLLLLASWRSMRNREMRMAVILGPKYKWFQRVIVLQYLRHT